MKEFVQPIQCWFCGEELDDGVEKCPACGKGPEQDAEAGTDKKNNHIEAILKKHLSGGEGNTKFYFYPDIPTRKYAGAKKGYLDLVKDEKIICLYDYSVFNNGAEGCCFSTKGFYWRVSEIFPAKRYIGFFFYDDIRELKIYNDTESIKDIKLFINGKELKYFHDIKKLLFNVLNEIIAYKKQNV